MKKGIRYLSLTTMLIAVLLCSGISTCMADATSDFQHGKELVEGGDCSAATQVLAGVVSADPTLAPKALQMMGGCYKKLREWPKAIECYSTLLTTYSGSVAADKEVRRWIMDCHFANNDLQSGSLELQALLSEYPEDASLLHHVVGRRYQWQGKFSQAVVELEKAVELNTAPGDSSDVKDMKSRLMYCYLAANDLDSGSSLFQTLMSEYPEDASKWHHALGDYYANRGKTSQAIAKFNEAIATARPDDPELKDIRVRIVDCCRAAGDLQGVISRGRELVNDWPEDPNVPEWEIRVAAAYCDLQCYDQAVLLCDEIISRFPNTREAIEARVVLAEALAGQGKAEEALAMLADYGLERPDQRAEALFGKGQVLLMTGDYAGGASVLAQVISDYPKYRLVETAKYQRARAYILLRQPEKARDLLLAMRSEPPGPYEFKTELALHECLVVEKKWAEARQAYQEMYDRLASSDGLTPFRIGALKSWIGDCCLHLGDYAAAVEAFDYAVNNCPGTRYPELCQPLLEGAREKLAASQQNPGH